MTGLTALSLAVFQVLFAVQDQPVTSDGAMSARLGYEVAGLFGGNDPEISRRLAAGAIGCPVKEIGISNEDSHRGIHTFTAHCRGGEYFCTYHYPEPINCSRAAGTTDADVEANRAALGEKMEAWKAQVSEHLRAVWVRPTDSASTAKAVMRVRLDEQGRLLNLQWVAQSGDRRFDKSVKKAFEKAHPYPAPPDPGAANSGIEFSLP